MPSAASDRERFFVRLVRAAFDAVYAMSSADCRLVECAETLTMRAHSAARQERERGSHTSRRGERADVERCHPLRVVELLESANADVDRAGGVHQHIALAPSSGDLGERGIDLFAHGEVGADSECVGTAAVAQLGHRTVESLTSPREHGDACALGGEARGRRATHALRPSADDGRGTSQAEIHRASSWSAPNLSHFAGSRSVRACCPPDRTRMIDNGGVVPGREVVGGAVSDDVGRERPSEQVTLRVVASQRTQGFEL